MASFDSSMDRLNGYFRGRSWKIGGAARLHAAISAISEASA